MVLWADSRSPSPPDPGQVRIREERRPLLTQLLASSVYSSWLESIVPVYRLAGRGNGLVCLPNLRKVEVVGQRDAKGGTGGGDGR